ncbi:hypothetical protein KUG47_05325 [Falsochrobactrum sp. TDYN1]|uniref:Uncharacterized protein n=1 Tax=Falsochrobactrum tianjinense TaxID=2706015 RepID=A0A949UTM6_9HYPH|nr:hypothetical protein [Falsochrobactrum sp. TDYN1]MBV2142917.1 hypothetical protein [Falsochrobactrum sp. TDYN1]
MSDKHRRHFLPGFCAALVVVLLSYAGANADEQQIARMQPLPEKPSETAPQEIDQPDSLVPTEALEAFGIDPIITGPAPKA